MTAPNPQQMQSRNGQAEDLDAAAATRHLRSNGDERELDSRFAELTLSPAWMRTRSDTRSPFTTVRSGCDATKHELIAVAHEVQ